MNTDPTKDELIDAILKDAHGQVQPHDSWEALRSRIDDRINDRHLSSTSIAHLGKNIVFWRRIALAMAACLVITSTLLIYVLGPGGGNRQRNITTVDQGMLNQAQFHQLNEAFSHVRQIFGQHCPWMVVGSSGEGEIGVENQTTEAVDTNNVIIVRLAVNVEKQNAQRRYFDVVTFPSQQANFRISVADSSDMEIFLRPILSNAGRIKVEINTRIEGGSPRPPAARGSGQG